MEQDKKNLPEIAQKNTDPASFFDTDDGFILAYKKTEKLASAIYMVSNLFSENEPMKWTLRKKIGELLSFSLTYKDIPESGHPDFLYEIKTRVLELVSLLEVSYRGGFLSQMNLSILKQEFMNLVSIVSLPKPVQKNVFNKDIAKDFFDEPTRHETNNKRSDTSNFLDVPHANYVPKMSFSSVKDIEEISTPKDDIKRSNRQNIILGLLKKKKELSINDIVEVIRDCSEKTIQRELNSFIALGVVKRAGVRRWSKYSLV